MEWSILIIALTYTIFVYLTLILGPTCFTINSRLFCKNHLLKPNSKLNIIFPYKNTMYSPHLKVIAFTFIASIIILCILIILFLLIKVVNLFDIELFITIGVVLLILQLIFNFIIIVYVNLKNKILFKIEHSMDRSEYNKIVAYLNSKYENFDA